MKKLNIELRSWDYTCGDGCCYDSGTFLILNGEELEHPLSTKDMYIGNTQLGQDVENALKSVLEKLGYEVEIKNTYSGDEH